jgi:hypothetical protein
MGDFVETHSVRAGRSHDRSSSIALLPTAPTGSRYVRRIHHCRLAHIEQVSMLKISMEGLMRARADSEGRVTSMRFAIVAALLICVAGSSIAQQEPPLVRLTKQATSPQMRATARGIVSDRDNNLAGWLVLNAARFRNSEYPELAKHLRETYAVTGNAGSSDLEFTQLPYEPNELDSHGQIVRGIAICPSTALCGLTGALAPFNLEASL